MWQEFVFYLLLPYGRCSVSSRSFSSCECHFTSLLLPDLLFIFIFFLLTCKVYIYRTNIPEHFDLLSLCHCYTDIQPFYLSTYVYYNNGRAVFPLNSSVSYPEKKIRRKKAANKEKRKCQRTAMCHRLLFVIEIRFDSSTAVTMWLRSVKMSCHAIATLAANFCFNRTSSTIDRRSLSGQVFSVMIVLFPSLPLENTGLYKKKIEI